MSNIPSLKSYIQIEGARFRSAVSESLIQGMGGTLNWLLDRDFQGQMYTADFSLVIPSNANNLFIYGSGGGAGGGGGGGGHQAPAVSGGGGGGGGGAGYPEMKFIMGAAGQTLNAVIGGPGSAGGAGNTNASGGSGGNGGLTSIYLNGFLQAQLYGGVGGEPGNSAGVPGRGGSFPPRLDYNVGTAVNIGQGAGGGGSGGNGFNGLYGATGGIPGISHGNPPGGGGGAGAWSAFGVGGNGGDGRGDGSPFGTNGFNGGLAAGGGGGGGGNGTGGSPGPATAGGAGGPGFVILVYFNNPP